MDFCNYGFPEPYESGTKKQKCILQPVVERWICKTPQEFILPSFNHIGQCGEAQEEGDGMGDHKQQCQHLPHWGQAERIRLPPHEQQGEKKRSRNNDHTRND